MNKMIEFFRFAPLSQAGAIRQVDALARWQKDSFPLIIIILHHLL
ncbi:hypothetical protein [Paenibacillus sp. HWE-109]|nr:hypothetical protein [Paenibacillus sp. HWE-109]